MGLFGFGKKKRQSEEAAEAAAEENDKADEAISETAEAPAGGIQETILPEPSDEYDGRGDEHGPWDVDDENVPDYDEYLDMGAYYLPFLQGIELRVKANRATQQVLGTTITYGSSSVEIEAFAAPKTMGLWDDVRADLVEANKDAKETDGVFGTELTLPVWSRADARSSPASSVWTDRGGCCAASSPAKPPPIRTTPKPRR